MDIAFIGLGVMGFPMAGHLQQAGHSVRVYNRTAARAQLWQDTYGGQQFATPGEAAVGAELVCLCVGNDDDVCSVVFGDQGALDALQPGATIVDHTTASAELAAALYGDTAARGIDFLDAPVSGGQSGAEAGALTIMVGGESKVFDAIAPVLQSYATYIKLLGPAGSGQLAKMVNQICIAGVVQGLAEGMAFAERTGLNTSDVIEVISQGAAQSWQMDNRHATMLQGHYEHGFAVDWMRKDLAMVLAQAKKAGLELPLTSLVDGFYSEIQTMGGGRWDTSSLFERLQRQEQVLPGVASE